MLRQPTSGRSFKTARDLPTVEDDSCRLRLTVNLNFATDILLLTYLFLFQDVSTSGFSE